jgi:hypothetical protein
VPLLFFVQRTLRAPRQRLHLPARPRRATLQSGSTRIPSQQRVRLELAGTNRERPNGIVVTLTGRSLARDKATQATASDTSSQRQCLAGPSRSANALSAQINLLIAGREAVTGKICLVPSGVRSEKRRPSLNHPRLWATFLFAEASDTTLITGAPGISSDLMLWRPDGDVFHLGRQS